MDQGYSLERRPRKSRPGGCGSGPVVDGWCPSWVTCKQTTRATWTTCTTLATWLAWRTSATWTTLATRTKWRTPAARASLSSWTILATWRTLATCAMRATCRPLCRRVWFQTWMRISIFLICNRVFPETYLCFRWSPSPIEDHQRNVRFSDFIQMFGE